VKIGQIDETGAFSASVPATAQAGWNRAAVRATVFVQARGVGAISGAASVPLVAPAAHNHD
jgi:hypothetical protein